MITMIFGPGNTQEPQVIRSDPTILHILRCELMASEIGLEAHRPPIRFPYALGLMSMDVTHLVRLFQPRRRDSTDIIDFCRN